MTSTLTIPQLAAEAAERWAHAVCVIDGARRLTFVQLAERMQTAAAAFVAAGLEPGQRVALWAPNCADWIIACLGLQAAGGILVPLNTRFRGQEAQYILNRSKASMLIAASEFLGTQYASLLAGLELPFLRRSIYFRERHRGSSWDAFLEGGADAAARREAEARRVQISPQAVSDIMFTSGTTGEPKGVVAAHEQAVKTARLWTRATTLGEGDRYLILWPFFHCAGYKAGWLPCLAVGAVILPEADLNVPRLVATVERERVTFLPGPPTLFQTLLSSPELDVKSLSSVRVSVTGASSVAPSMIEAMRKDLGIPVVLTGYGLTETCGTVTMTNSEDPPDIVATSCGRAIEGIEVAVVLDDGRRTRAGGPGEVVVKGMNTMQGYLDDPQSTAAAVDRDGWLHTGDIGMLDEAGYLRITDRKKDMFIVGGFNCYPAEIEKMLLAHPAIRQVAVVGVPDARLGEVAKAYVVLKANVELDAGALIAWSRERMANFKVPRSVVFLSALPTNATGKVQKFRLASA